VIQLTTNSIQENFHSIRFTGCGIMARGQMVQLVHGQLLTLHFQLSESLFVEKSLPRNAKLGAG